MIEITKKINELVNGEEKCPLPIDVIPNLMGINLCSVDTISWKKQKDGQLKNITINFIPDASEKE